MMWFIKASQGSQKCQPGIWAPESNTENGGKSQWQDLIMASDSDAHPQTTHWAADKHMQNERNCETRRNRGHTHPGNLGNPSSLKVNLWWGKQWFIEQIATVPPSLPQINSPLAGIHLQRMNSYVILSVLCFFLVKVAVLLSGDSICLALVYSETWQHRQILSRFRWCEVHWQSFPQHILQVTHMGASVLLARRPGLSTNTGFLWTLSSHQSLYSLCCFLYILS